MVNTVVAKKSNKIFWFYGDRNEQFRKRRVREDLCIQMTFSSDYSDKSKIENILSKVDLNGFYDLVIQADNSELGTKFILEITYNKTGMKQEDLFNLILKDLALLESLILDREEKRFPIGLNLLVNYDKVFLIHKDPELQARLKRLGFEENEYEGNTYERYDRDINYVVRFDEDEDKVMMHFYDGNIKKHGVTSIFFDYLIRLSSYYYNFVEEREAK